MSRRNMDKALIVIQNLDSEELISELLNRFTKEELIFLCGKLKITTSNKNKEMLKEDILNSTVRLKPMSEVEREISATKLMKEQFPRDRSKRHVQRKMSLLEIDNLSKDNPPLTDKTHPEEDSKINFTLMTEERIKSLMIAGEDERSDYAFSYLAQFIEAICDNKRLDYIDEYLVTCILVDTVNERFGLETKIIGKSYEELGDLLIEHEFILGDLRLVAESLVEEFIYIVLKLELSRPYIFKTLDKMYKAILRETLMKTEILRFYIKLFSK